MTVASRAEALAERDDAIAAVRFDGAAPDELAHSLGIPAVHAFAAVGSTLDVAHALAAGGAPAGTLVVADEQTRGRGRQGRRWSSEPGAGLWLTLVERPASASLLGVASVRVALRLAGALDIFADGPVRVKWPNDVHVGDGKVAGVLLEARWRGAVLDWLAVGVGINLRAPAVEGRATAGLRAATRRRDVLAAVVPALREAVATAGSLGDDERSAWHARDLAVGRRAVEPAAGIVAGISADGALLVDTGSGTVACHAGSLLLSGASGEIEEGS